MTEVWTTMKTYSRNEAKHPAPERTSQPHQAPGLRAAPLAARGHAEDEMVHSL